MLCDDRDFLLAQAGHRDAIAQRQHYSTVADAPLPGARHLLRASLWCCDSRRRRTSYPAPAPTTPVEPRSYRACARTLCNERIAADASFVPLRASADYRLEHPNFSGVGSQSAYPQAWSPVLNASVGTCPQALVRRQAHCGHRPPVFAVSELLGRLLELDSNLPRRPRNRVGRPHRLLGAQRRILRTVDVGTI